MCACSIYHRGGGCAFVRVRQSVGATVRAYRAMAESIVSVVFMVSSTEVKYFDLIWWTRTNVLHVGSPQHLEAQPCERCVGPVRRGTTASAVFSRQPRRRRRGTRCFRAAFSRQTVRHHRNNLQYFSQRTCTIARAGISCSTAQGMCVDRSTGYASQARREVLRRTAPRVPRVAACLPSSLGRWKTPVRGCCQSKTHLT